MFAQTSDLFFKRTVKRLLQKLTRETVDNLCTEKKENCFSAYAFAKWLLYFVLIYSLSVDIPLLKTVLS